MLTKGAEAIQAWDKNTELRKSMEAVAASKQQAYLGSGRINVIQTKFRTLRSQRALHSRHVKILALDIEAQGVKSADSAHVLTLGVKKEWLKC